MKTLWQSSVGAAFAAALRAGLLLCVAGGLAGCGQKGPLTLPPPAKAASAPPTGR